MTALTKNAAKYSVEHVFRLNAIRLSTLA